MLRFSMLFSAQVLSDYTSDELDLSDEKVFRDLTKPSESANAYIDYRSGGGVDSAAVQ